MPARPTGVILLSFDDRFTDGWVEAIPLFAEHRARVTFFVDHFHELTTRQVDDLHRLAGAGHEVGCHGLTHASAPDLITSLGPDGLLAEEIDPAIRSMHAHGFEPRSFAYPRSRRTPETDVVLWRRFTRLRTGLTSTCGVPTPSFDACFFPMADRVNHRLIVGKSIDEVGITDTRLDGLVTRAAEAGSCLALYAHAITEHAEHHYISPRRLKRLLHLADRNGLRLECFHDAPTT